MELSNNNIISVYNQLVGLGPNTDYGLFEKIIDDNHAKFRYFYDTFKKMSLKNVVKVFCDNSDSHELDITLIFDLDTADDFIDDYIEIFEGNLDDEFYNKFFEFDLSKDGNILNICISADKKESEIYEIRFNTRR